MNDLNTMLAGIGAAACWYFVVAFWVTTGGDWRRNPGGRHVMQFTANLGLLMTLIVLARVWPQYPGRAAVTLVAFAALVAQVVWRCVLLHRTQHAPAGR
ncbi:putative phage holin [Micromonospora marina]|uniref:putative phage holin n=1 Tax=Micromonospora marina TaxID=307120 RepID=UPI0034573775